MDRRHDFETVQVRVGEICAHCPCCGGAQFLRARHTPGLYSDGLLCTACGMESRRTQLANQISNEVVRQSKAMLASLRAMRKH